MLPAGETLITAHPSSTSSLPTAIDPAHESSALYYLSSLSLFKGDFPSAEELARKSLRKATDAMDLHRIGLAWGARGNVARRKGSFEKAESFYTESLSVFERMGDEVGRSVALGNLGIVAYRQNKLERALDRSSSSRFSRLERAIVCPTVGNVPMAGIPRKFSSSHSSESVKDP